MSGELLDQIAEEDQCQQTETAEELSLREGGVHFCEGPLQRKRHRAQAKIKKWKQKWFKVEPGKESNTNPRACFRLQAGEHYLQALYTINPH